MATFRSQSQMSDFEKCANHNTFSAPSPHPIPIAIGISSISKEMVSFDYRVCKLNEQAFPLFPYSLMPLMSLMPLFPTPLNVLRTRRLPVDGRCRAIL